MPQPCAPGTLVANLYSVSRYRIPLRSRRIGFRKAGPTGALAPRSPASKRMKQLSDKDTVPRLNHLQMYLAEEFVEEYNEGLMTRRELLAKILGITGGVASASALLLTLGCAPPAAAPTSTAAPAAKPAATTAPTGAPAKAAATAAPTGAPAKPTGAAAAAPTSAARSPLSVPANDPAISAQDVTFQGNGATLMAYLARPASGGPFPAVMVCHENRGLTEHIKDVARRLAKAGYVALAVDLLARDGGTDKVDPTQVPGKLTADPARNVADFQAAFTYLNGQSQVQKGNIGMVGFCFGGGVTYMVATAIPELKAAVPFYGPNPPLTDVPKIRAAVLGIYGETDTRITGASGELEQAMKATGKTFEKVVYPGVGHAFHNDTGAAYNEQAATDAWKRTLDWFKKYLV